MPPILDLFRSKGKLDVPLAALSVLICCVLLTNALLHDPAYGYDAQDHQHYVQALATNWRLPNPAETGQYYSPPLPYVLPAVLTALHSGLWKAMKLAQVGNALLAAAMLLYVLKICTLVSPESRRLKLLCLGLIGMLPVFYRSFALVRGEPYLAFLAVFTAYQTLMVFSKQDPSTRRVLLLGCGLGLAILARQWGFFLFPAVVVFGLWQSRMRAWKPVLVVVVIALLIGGWFYALILRQYGTLTAFDRPAQPLTAQKIPALFGIDASSGKVFSDPIRPSLQGRVGPIFYADIWGDYWGYFLVYARDANTGEFQTGKSMQKFSSPAAVPPGMVTNRFEINHYLGVLNALALPASAALVCGFLFGCWALLRFLTGRATDEADRAAALFAMIAGTSLAGFLWFILGYQSPAQAGDLVKATYLLQAFPPLAFMAGLFLDGALKRWPAAQKPIAAVLGLTFAAALPASLTHYVHLSSGPGLVWFTGSALFFIVGMGVTWWVHTRFPMDVVVEPGPAPKSGPLISICVPARNEAANIRRCVEGMLQQTYPNFEVIVVDDRSTDETPAILGELARDPRLQVLHGAEMPPGWAGKPHALMQAAAAARGDWLCFVDADTFLSPDALAGSYRKAVETGADLFTILTYQLTGTFWERVVLPLVMTALSVGFPPRAVNDPKTRTAVANGQFILIRREVYQAIGGHERIKDQIVEDKAMAELVKWNGYRLVLADGRKVAQTRMYTSLPQMWEGWTKNIFLGLRAQPNLVFLGAFGGLQLVLAALFLPVWPVLGLLWYLHGGGWPALAIIAMALILWAAILQARAAVLRAMDIPRWYAFTTPLGAGIFAAMMIVSAWKVVSGRGVTWRGRRYNPAPRT